MMRTPKAGQTFGVFHMQNLLNGQGLHKKLFKISCNPEKAEFSGSGFRILFAHRVLFRGFFAFFTSDSLAILL